MPKVIWLMSRELRFELRPPELTGHIKGTPMYHLAQPTQRQQLPGQMLCSQPTRGFISPSRSAGSGANVKLTLNSQLPSFAHLSGNFDVILTQIPHQLQWKL